MEKQIDRQALIDLIIDAKRTEPETGSFTEWLADYLIEHLPIAQPNEWISVGDRLPESENEQVLMTDGERCHISSKNNMVRFLDCEGIFIPGKSGAGVKVTHWQHLPAPPVSRSPEEEEI